MVNIADLELAHLGVDRADFAADPAPEFARARAQHPWLAKCAYGYIVTDYQTIRDVLGGTGKMHIAFENAIEVMGAKGTPWGDFQERNIFALTGEPHKRLRDTVAHAFTPRQANENRDLMRNVITGLLDEWVPKGQFDFVEFASNFPVAVVCCLLGAPLSEVKGIKESLDAIGLSHSMDRSLLPAMQEGIRVLDEFTRTVIRRRRQGERQERSADLLDALLQAHDGGGLTERQLVDLFLTLLVGGYDTSKNMLAVTMYTLIQHPEHYRRCAEDIGFCRKVIEESMRRRSIATAMRVLDEDIHYRDVLMPAGTVLFFGLPLATRDARVVPDPDTFDPERRQATRHLGFGLGEHLCLGQFIARALMEEGLHLIAQRIVNPRTPGPSGWRPFLGATGPNDLPIAFDPAPAPAAGPVPA